MVLLEIIGGLVVAFLIALGVRRYIEITAKPTTKEKHK